VTDRTFVVTGSHGLIGSALVRALCLDSATSVIGVDNNGREEFFGTHGSTSPMGDRLVAELPNYERHSVDVSDRKALWSLLTTRARQVAAIVHCAAQPSHDWAGANPCRDFDINAVGTINLLDWYRQHTPSIPFVFLSSNKVYSYQTVGSITLVEHAERFDVSRDSPFWAGLTTDLSVGVGSRCLYGTSKLAADLLAQEYAYYFGLPITILRCGSMTGPHHAAVALHGFVGYVAQQAAIGGRYEINGYSGKQVRDTLYYSDVIDAILSVIRAQPTVGPHIYNLGGGRDNACSVLECLRFAVEESGKTVDIEVLPSPRLSDFRWWITDNRPFIEAHPNWRVRVSLRQMIAEAVSHMPTATPQST